MKIEISVYDTVVNTVESSGAVPAKSENKETVKLPQSWVTSRLTKAVAAAMFTETGVSQVKYSTVYCGCVRAVKTASLQLLKNSKTKSIVSVILE